MNAAFEPATQREDRDARENRQGGRDEQAARDARNRRRELPPPLGGLRAMRRSAEKTSERLATAASYLTIVGAVCLLGIVAIVTFGVVRRYLFGDPMLGVNEMVQMTAVALVAAALPYCTAREEHVAVDVFDRAIGRFGRFIGDIVARGLSAFVLGVLCYRAALKAFDAQEWGDATNMLQMPLWPFYATLAAGAGLCALVFALQLVVTLVRGPR